MHVQRPENLGALCIVLSVDLLTCSWNLTPTPFSHIPVSFFLLNIAQPVTEFPHCDHS